MKKSIIPFLAIATLLASCGGNSSTGESSNTEDSSTSTAAKYSVTASKGNDYKVEGLAEDGYEAGATVSFTVSISNTNKEVDKVIVDGKQLVASNGTYSFTMPSKNVNIIVQLKDKAGVKVATIAVDNEAPKVGDTVNVTLKLDGEALTSGVSVTATSGADLVTITGTSVKCNDVGAITLEASATVDGIEYKKTIDLTIGEATKITSIKTIQDVMPTFVNKNATYDSQVTVEGRVINVNYNGIVVYDGTGIISVYDSASKTVAKVGEYVRITGTPTRYQSSASDTRWWQFSYSDTGLSIAKIEHSEIALPEAVAFSASDFSNYVTPAAGTVKRVTFSGTVAIDGSHTNISMDGVTGRTLSYYSEDFTVENGLKYNFEAFLAELQSGKFLVAYVTNVTAVEMDPVESVAITNGATATVEVSKKLQLNASVLPSTANPNVSWSSNDTTKATVSEDGEVTGVAEGTAVITATTEGKDSSGAAKTATITITVTAATASDLPEGGLTIDCNTFPLTYSYASYETVVSDISISGSALMKTGKYSPYKQTETGLDHDFVQLQKANGYITVGTLNSASKVTAVVVASYATQALAKLPSVVYGASDTVAATTESSYTGEKFAEGIASGNNTLDLYRYSIEYTLTDFASSTITVKAPSGNAAYIESIVIA